MLRHRVFLAFMAFSFGTQAFAGGGIPIAGAGVVGPAALVAAIGAIIGVKHLRNRRK